MKNYSNIIECAFQSVCTPLPKADVGLNIYIIKSIDFGLNPNEAL